MEKMLMFARFVQFGRDENGAVTVDWVVLTAAVVGVALIFMIPITQSAQSTSLSIATTIDSAKN
jgi:Flp pilus assembly pilin Flp